MYKFTAGVSNVAVMGMTKISICLQAVYPSGQIMGNQTWALMLFW